MLPISQIYSDQLKRRAREWLIKVDIDGVEYGMDQIVDISITNEIADGYDGFTVGTANISSCTLQLRTTDAIPPNAKVVPYIALSLADMTWDSADYAWDDADFAWDGSITTDWLPLGTFYVDNRKQKGMIWTFECYDGLTFADVAYVSQLDYPTTMQAVWGEVCAQSGLLYDSSVQIDPSHTLNAGPAGYTCRQVMSYIAGCHGASVKMSRTGEISWRTYTADEFSVYEMTEADYVRVKQTNPVKTYTRVVVTYDEDDQLTYEAGEGDDNHTLYLTNPLMTQTMVDDLLTQISGFAYVPIEMDARGYPQLEHGDRIAYDRSESMSWVDAGMSWDDADFAWDGIETYQTLILEQTFTFRGGLGMTLDAPSVSEQESEFDIDGTLTAAVKRLNENAVRFGKPYHGITHSREHGFVTQRTDGSKKLTINSDVLLDWVVNGQRKLYYDESDDTIKFAGNLQAAGGTFTGTLEAADGEFTGTLTAAVINGSEINGSEINGGEIYGSYIEGAEIAAGEINGAFIDGGIITGALIQTSETSFPRIEFSSTNNLLSAQSGPGESVSIYANNLSTAPAVVWRGSNTHYLWELDGELTFTSTSDVTITPNNFVNFRSWWDVRNLNTNQTLQEALDSKPNRGITANIVTGDGVGNLVIFNFSDGVLVNWDVV